MFDVHTLAERTFEVYESHTGDLCPWSASQLGEAFSLLDEDTSVDALESAFEEAGIWMGGLDDEDLFFEDLSTLLSEDAASFV